MNDNAKLIWNDRSYEMVRYSYQATETFAKGGGKTSNGVGEMRAERFKTHETGGSYSFNTGDITTEYVRTETSRYTVPAYHAHVDHGIGDARGRSLGHDFSIEAAELGWEMRPHSTRDGKPFGAVQRRQAFPTLEAAKAHAEVLAARGRKAAVKKAGVAQVNANLAAERRNADRIDGYDRDDLGESPDF